MAEKEEKAEAKVDEIEAKIDEKVEPKTTEAPKKVNILNTAAAIKLANKSLEKPS